MCSSPDKNLPTLIYLISAAGACPVVDSNKPAFYKSCIYNSLKGLQANFKKVGPIFVFITAFATSKTLLLGFIRPKETNWSQSYSKIMFVFIFSSREPRQRDDSERPLRRGRVGLQEGLELQAQHGGRSLQPVSTKINWHILPK